MREAMGSSYLLYLIVIMVTIIIFFFVGILAYSKAYKVKNRIIQVIESYETYDTNVVNALNADLLSIGYQSLPGKPKCDANTNLNTTNFNYCVYKICMEPEVNGICESAYYYQVVSYVHFRMPVISTLLNIPVKGETQILGKTYDY